MRMSYSLGIYLAFSYIFGISDIHPLINLIHFVLILTLCVTTYLWLKKNIILFGLAFFFLSFNFSLLYSPLIPNSGILSLDAVRFFFLFEVIATLFVVAGAMDSYFGDKYLDFKSNLKPAPIIIAVVLGTIFRQIMIRTFG